MHELLPTLCMDLVNVNRKSLPLFAFDIYLSEMVQNTFGTTPATKSVENDLRLILKPIVASY